jgi:hypothetical protein
LLYDYIVGIMENHCPLNRIVIENLIIDKTSVVFTI